MAKIERKGTKKVSKWEKAKATFLTGTSYMIPVIVTAGFLQAIAKAIGGYDVATNPDMVGTFAYNLVQLGAGAMVMVIPVLAAAIAWAIGDKPAIAPGLAVGYLSTQVIKAGFVGGVAGGVAAGFMVLYMRKIKVPSWLNGLMNIMIIPLATTFVVGMLLYYIIGGPIAAAMAAFSAFLNSMEGGSKFMLGAVIGSCWGIDYGGPVTQTAAAFCNALNTEGIYGPTAIKMAAGMAPPIAVALTAFLNRKRFNAGDMENAKVAIPLGCCFITEGALPFFLNDPIRVWLSCIPGCALGGALAYGLGVESPALHGGIFAIPLMNKPLVFLMALGANILLATTLYSILLRINFKKDKNKVETAGEN